MPMNEGKAAADLLGIPPPRDTREKILFAALDLFYRHGFHEVGIDRVIAAVGVTKTTFYNHFESRDHLILEALGVRETWENSAMERGMRARAGYDPRALLLATFDVLDEWFNHPDYRGCMFVLASAQFPLPSDPIHKRAAQAFRTIEEATRGMAKAAGIADPDAFSRKYVMLVEGALVRRLVTGDNSSAREARDIVARMLEAEVGASPAPRVPVAAANAPPPAPPR